MRGVLKILRLNNNKKIIIDWCECASMAYGITDNSLEFKYILHISLIVECALARNSFPLDLVISIWGIRTRKKNNIKNNTKLTQLINWKYKIITKKNKKSVVRWVWGRALVGAEENAGHFRGYWYAQRTIRIGNFVGVLPHRFDCTYSSLFVHNNCCLLLLFVFAAGFGWLSGPEHLHLCQ